MGQHERSAVTPLAVAVLALLEERPMHPYEMYQLLISRREDMLVKVRPGSLYHTVARLAEQELVVAEGVDRAGNRPERTTYRITEGGHLALRARIAQIMREPAREYPVFPVAIAEAHNLPTGEVLALLRERSGHLADDLADVEMMIEWASQHEVPRRYWVVLEYLRAMLHAELTWVEQFIGELDSGELAWQHYDSDGAQRVPDPEHPWATDLAESLHPPRRRRTTTDPQLPTGSH